jgi:hypothetical protein
MREVSVLGKENLGGEDAKSRQPISKHYPKLTDPRDPLFMIPLIKNKLKKITFKVKHRFQLVGVHDVLVQELEAIEVIILRELHRWTVDMGVCHDGLWQAR